MSVRKTPRAAAVPAAQMDWLSDLPPQGLDAGQALSWLRWWTEQGLLRHIDSALAAQLLRLDPQAGAPLLVAGDFNDWGGKLREPMARFGLRDFARERVATYPSRLPLTQLDYVYARGMDPLRVTVPRGRTWARMSDHLPLLAEFAL